MLKTDKLFSLESSLQTPHFHLHQTEKQRSEQELPGYIWSITTITMTRSKEEMDAGLLLFPFFLILRISTARD